MDVYGANLETRLSASTIRLSRSTSERPIWIQRKTEQVAKAVRSDDSAYCQSVLAENGRKETALEDLTRHMGLLHWPIAN